MSITIVLADDHTVVRAGLRSLLDNDPEFDVVAEASNGRETVEMVRDHQPQVVIMDVAMPELNGVEATRQILGIVPHVKVLGLSMHSDKRFVITMLKAGAAGYLLKNCATRELKGAIRTIVENRTYISPDIANLVVDALVREDDPPQDSGKTALSPREREVLQLLAEGGTVKAIAQQLHVSPSTVESHRRQIMEKLDLHSIAELTKYAIREGLTFLDQ